MGLVMAIEWVGYGCMVSELTPTRQTPTHTCLYPYTLIGMDLYPYSYLCLSRIRYPIGTRYPPPTTNLVLVLIGVVLEARQCTGGGDVEGRVCCTARGGGIMCCHAGLLEAWRERRGGMHKHMRWSMEKGAQWRALEADPRGSS